MTKENLKTSVSSTVIEEVLDGRIKKVADVHPDFGKAAAKLCDTPIAAISRRKGNMHEEKAEQMLVDLVNVMMIHQSGPVAEFLKYDFDYNVESDAYVLQFTIKDGLEGQASEKAREEAIQFFTDLARYADLSVTKVFPDAGHLYINTKMDFLTLLKNKITNDDFSHIIDVFSTQNSSSNHGASSEVDQSDDYNKAILESSYVRPYSDYQSYLTAAQAAHASDNRENFLLSSFITIAEEKIKIEDWNGSEPRMRKGLGLPKYFIN